MHNFKVSDNKLAGIEVSLSENAADNMAQIKKALVIGRSANTEPALDNSSPHGIITPRTENFTVSEIRFYNYNWNNAAAIGSCSHCFHSASTDSGARQVSFSDLYFDETVTRKIKYQFPHHAIYYDKDGTLTGKGPKTWATPHEKHHELPECETNLDMYDGVVCDSSIEVRRLAFHNYKPGNLLNGMDMLVLRYDDAVLAQNSNITKYHLERENYSKIFWKGKKSPGNSWTFPFVTGHKYKIHWAKTGLDFE